MRRFAGLVWVAAGALALAACSSSNGANEQAQPGNVEMPAEEAVGGLDAGATPVADSEDTASEAATAEPAPAASASPVATPTPAKP